MAVGPSMETRVGASVGLIERLSESLIQRGVPLDSGLLAEELELLAADEAPLATPDELQAVLDALIGFGPAETLLRDPLVTDVLINGPDEIWVERSGELERVDLRFQDDASIVAAVERMITPLGLRFDPAAPMIDARLPDGSRLHAVMPPASVDHPVAAIRRFNQAVASFEEMVDLGALSSGQRDELQGAVVRRANMIVSGGTGAGKTTLLNVLSTAIDTSHRVIVIEDASELQLSGHVVRLEAKPANAEGAGAITVRSLLRSALRLRPDRIVIGEVRGEEALDLVGALNTGHAGSMSTVHANSPDEAMWRLETLALSGSSRVGEVAVHRQLRASIDVVVQIERSNGRRSVTAIEWVDS